MQYGLQLTLNIEAEDYLATVTPVKGAKMLIHHHSDVPFPSDTGLDLSPLTETVVSLKRVSAKQIYLPRHQHGRFLFIA